MRNKTDITIRSGTVEAIVHDAPSRAFRVRWSIPEFDDGKRDALYRSFAADAFLAGRWSAGVPTEEDRSLAQAEEADWRSECGCGRPQPCRHAVTVMFRFREMAKENPWLWLGVRGMSREDAFAAVHEYRLRMNDMQALRTGDDFIVSIPLPEEEYEPAILQHAADPPFWNRDVSFADWLRHIYGSVKRGDA